VADAITTAREVIESRIKEIEEETARLKRALGGLVEGEGARRPRRRSSGSGRGARRGKIAPRGWRREELLAHLEKNPGARPAEIARAMGTTPANVHNVLRKARQDKVVRRSPGGGYALAKTAGPVAEREGDRERPDPHAMLDRGEEGSVAQPDPGHSS